MLCVEVTANSSPLHSHIHTYTNTTHIRMHTHTNVHRFAEVKSSGRVLEVSHEQYRHSTV